MSQFPQKVSKKVLYGVYVHVVEQHKKSVQRYHQQLRNEADSRRSVKEVEKQISDQQVWKRLEELELQEQRRKEMQQDTYVTVLNV